MVQAFVTFYMGPNRDSPTIDLIKGSSGRHIVYAESAGTKQLIPIILPPNCYLDPYEIGRYKCL